jgi:hypothetical protein
MKSFFDTLETLKKTYSENNISYNLKCNNKYFYDLNLENIIFTAKNKYELWLLVYKYLIQHTKFKTIQKISFDEKDNIQILNKITHKSSDEYYNIGEYWEILNICFEEESRVNLNMENVVELVVDDLFNNPILWLERCQNI